MRQLKPCSNRKLLVLGIGNWLCGDDGIGAVMAERLASSYQSNHADIINGGTIGLGLLYLFQDYSDLMILDSVDLASAPGSIFKFSLEDLERFHLRKNLSGHQAGPLQLLQHADLLGTLPENVVIIGIQIKRIDAGIGLSEELSEQLGFIESRLKEEIGLYLKTCMNCL